MGKDEGGAAMERGTELSGCIVMIPALDPGPDLAAYAAALLARGPEALVGWTTEAARGAGRCSRPWSPWTGAQCCATRCTGARAGP